MQTFIVDEDLRRSASLLDRIRLGNQRLEAIWIAQILVGINANSRWKNHPAVRMWRGYESYLIWEYLVVHMVEWAKRGYKNTRCVEYLAELGYLTLDKPPGPMPCWIDDNFIEAHRSNLIRKKEEFYAPLFPQTKRGLAYIWPVS